MFQHCRHGGLANFGCLPRARKEIIIDFNHQRTHIRQLYHAVDARSIPPSYGTDKDQGTQLFLWLHHFALDHKDDDLYVYRRKDLAPG
jgi:hypothetical protein